MAESELLLDRITEENAPEVVPTPEPEMDDDFTDEELSPANLLKESKKHYLRALRTRRAPDTDMIKILKDVSKLALDEKRLNQEDAIAKSDQEVAMAIAKMHTDGNLAPLLTPEPKMTVESLEDRFNDIDLPEFERVEGEMSTTQQTLRVDMDKLRR